MDQGESLLVSIHIPKTAGSTLLWILAQRFGARFQRAYKPPREGLEKSAADGWPDIADPLCIHGHGVFERFEKTIRAHARVKWMIFLREPLAGAISLYEYRKRYVAWGEAENKFADPGLEEFLLHGYNHDRYHQWVALAGVPPEEFELIGITERFDESILVLAMRLGWDLDLAYRPTNIGNYPPHQLSPALVEKFRSLNERDYALYDGAQGLLDRQISRFAPEFAQAMRAQQQRCVELERAWAEARRKRHEA